MGFAHHIVFPEHILMGFLKCFFGQEELFQGLPNEFQYVDGKKTKTLIIEMSEDYDLETANAIPAIVIQEGGWSEDRRVIDQRKLHSFSGDTWHKASLWYSFALHCIARHKGSSKALAAATSKSIMGFRHAIYELGVDTIDPLIGSPPQRLSSPNENVPGPYDSVVQIRMRMEQDWTLVHGLYPEEAVRIHFVAAIEEVERDENGDIVSPASGYFEQDIHYDDEE
jgi:hypothetical protein